MILLKEAWIGSLKLLLCVIYATAYLIAIANLIMFLFAWQTILQRAQNGHRIHLAKINENSACCTNDHCKLFVLHLASTFGDIHFIQV
jgi:hypothetical protein